jgi:putative endonuclease
VACDRHRRVTTASHKLHCRLLAGPSFATVSPDPRRAVGALGERHAEAHLARAGYRILDRNWRSRAGELDLVAARRGCLVFCEVRTRVGCAPHRPGGPLDSIGARKRRRLRRLAREWLGAGGGRVVMAAAELRFDAIAVTLRPDGTLAALEHLEAAF